MRILVFGAGAIGSVVGGFLSRSSNEVILYGRARRLSSVKRNGLKVTGILGRHTFKHFKLCTKLSKLSCFLRAFDLVLLTVKSFDTRRAARELKPLIGPHTLVCSLQNGLGNIETLHEFFPKRQVLAGRVIFGSELKRDRANVTVWGGDVLIGETQSLNMTSRVGELAKLFTRAGIRSKPVRDIRTHLWGKVIYNCSLNPLASLLGVHYGELLEHPETRLIMRAIVGECYAVAKRARIRLTPKTPAAYEKLLFRRLIPATYHHHPSMLYDLKRSRKTEIDVLNGAVCRLGKRFGVKTPVNQFVTQLVKRKTQI